MKKKIFVVLLTFLVCVVGMNAQSSTNKQVSSTVKMITAYPTGTGIGDVTVTLNEEPPGGVAFWLDPDEPGFKTTYSILLTAQATGKSVTIDYDTSSTWVGSGMNYYRVYCVSLLN